MPYTIAVLVKQVPDMNAIRIDRATGKPTLSGQLVISSYDECAIEAALRLKEAHGGEVVVIAAGGPGVKDAITRTLAMGADRGVLLKFGDLAELDTLAVADALAEQVRRISPDIVLVGQTSDDYNSGHVGPQVAELLGMPQIGSIASIVAADDLLAVERDTEDGRQTIQVRTPVLLMAQTGLNEPRYPSLKGIMAAKKKSIEEVSATDAGRQGRIAWGEPVVPARESAGVMLSGVPAADAASQLVTWLKERKLA